MYFFCYFDCSFPSFVMHHPICFNWKARNEITTATAIQQQWKKNISSVVCESFGVATCQINMPYVLMIQRKKQWLVTHYYFSVFEREKNVFFFHCTWDDTIRFEYSNILKHQQQAANESAPTAANSTNVITMTVIATTKLMRRQHHKTNNTFFTRFLLAI